MSSFIKDYLNKLPEDLQLDIYSRIKYPQNKNLILDIKTFYMVKKSIYSEYLSNVSSNDNEEDYYNNNNIHSCIDNDLMRFFNDNINYFHEKTRINEIRMNRILAYRIKYKLYNNKATFNFDRNTKTCPKTHINRYIGCLNVDERGELLTYLNVLCILDE